jgi:CMP-N,N'-diacetyllegionaminic acid synthase
MDVLFLITARGGSKGIPEKNIKSLAGKPLIHYSIEIARNFVDDEFICVSTDDDKIIKAVETLDLKVPFKRPSELATDTAGSYEVIMHAIQYYAGQGIHFEKIVLLQPTSPFRTKDQIAEALALFNDDTDMVVSVKETKSNPFHLLYLENEKGFLEKVIEELHYDRRQAAPKVYELNGAIYVLNVRSLKEKKISEFTKIKKYLMSELTSVDIDTPLDWEWSEFLIEKKLIHFG